MRATKIIYILIWACISFLFTSCGKQQLTVDEYLLWMKDSKENGLKKEKKVAQYKFELSYRPAAFMLAKEIKKEGLTLSEAQGRKLDFENMDFYNLKISLADNNEDFLKVGIANDQEYQKRIYYYAYRFQKKIALEDDYGKIPCQLYHFERSYDLTNTRTFVLAFPKRKEKVTYKTLIIDAEELQLSPVKIRFDNEILDNIPELKLQS